MIPKTLHRLRHTKLSVYQETTTRFAPTVSFSATKIILSIPYSKKTITNTDPSLKTQSQDKRLIFKCEMGYTRSIKWNVTQKMGACSLLFPKISYHMSWHLSRQNSTLLHKHWPARSKFVWTIAQIVGLFCPPQRLDQSFPLQTCSFSCWTHFSQPTPKIEQKREGEKDKK